MEHSEWPCLSVQMIQDAFVWAKQIFRLTDHLTEMGDINNVLVISKCIPAVPAILRLKAVSRNIFPEGIQDWCQDNICFPTSHPRKSKACWEKSKVLWHYNIKRKKKKKRSSTCPVVTFKSMEMRCPAWSKIAKALSDKSNGCCCWIKIHWVPKCSLEIQACQDAFFIIVLPSTGLLPASLFPPPITLPSSSPLLLYITIPP